MMSRDNESPVYIPTDYRDRVASVVKVFLSYAVALGVWLISINLYQKVGRTMILSLGTVMWLAGALVAYLIPDQGVKVANRTKYMIDTYAGTLIGYRLIVNAFSKISPNDWGAALGTHIPTPMSEAGAGWIEAMMVVMLVSVPVAYLSWLAQLVAANRGRGLVHEEMDRIQRRHVEDGRL